MTSWLCGPGWVDSQSDKINSLAAVCSAARCMDVGASLAPTSTIASSDFEQATFMKTNSGFDGAMHLDAFPAACLMEPRLLVPPPLDWVHPELLDLFPAGSGYLAGPLEERGLFQHGSTPGLMKFLKQWDVHDRLMLVDSKQVAHDERGELFEVIKDADATRVVFNRIPRNRKETHLAGAASLTPSGHAFCDIVIPEGEVLRLSAEDLSDYFPAFIGTRERALTNALGKVFLAKQFQGFRAFDDLARTCAGLGAAVPAKVLATNRGLVMGDLNACDWAVAAHMSVLDKSGSFPLSERMLNRAPLPRGSRLQGVVVDDRFVFTVGRASDADLHNSVVPIFDVSRAAYLEAGLQVSAHKAKRALPRGVVVGALVDGDLGSVGAPRGRRVQLAHLSLDLVTHPRTTGHAARALISCWNHALMFRRPLLAVVDRFYKDLPDTTLDKFVYDVSGVARSELCMLAVLVPVMESNLRAQVSGDVYATDASPYGLGATAMKVGPIVAKELFRRRERRGHYTQLHSKDAASLYARGLILDEDLEEDCPGPERVIIEMFDVLEICCGKDAPLMSACGDAGLRCGPRIDIAVHGFWDLEAPRVVGWIFFLLRNGRVRYFHSGVPCTVFSVARHPALTSRVHPWGFDKRHPKVALGVALLQVALLCLWIMARVPHGAATHEHPDSAHSWGVPFWDVLRRRADCCVHRFDAGAFGANFRKRTKLFGIRTHFLRPLERLCAGAGAANGLVALTGRATTAAAAYHPALCTEWAGLLKTWCDDSGPFLPLDVESLKQADTRGAYEKFYINDIASASEWEPVFSLRAFFGEHINVCELRALLELVKRIAPSHRHLRVLVLVDSRVALGCAAKGRSASPQLNRLLRQVAAWCIAFDVVLGFDFVPTRLNPADAPSRFRPVPAPRQPPPRWLRRAEKGDFDELDRLAGLPLQKKACSEWGRFVVSFATLRGVALRFGRRFDSTLGYPGEGPPRRKGPRDPALLKLLDDRGHTPQVVARRKLATGRFEVWLLKSRRINLISFLDLDVRRADGILGSYGKVLFEEGGARGVFAETINALVDVRRDWRRQLPVAWDTCWVWRGLEDSYSHIAMPDTVFLAFVAAAISWGWLDVAAILVVAFLGMLRPGEACALLVDDFVFHDLPGGGRCLFVRISNPKMRRLGPRREHVRLDDLEVIDFLKRILDGLPLDLKLFNGSYSDFCWLFGKLCDTFDIAKTDGVGLTPASLRAGGATFWYRRHDSAEWVRYRGRWSNTRMLEIYIQEAAACSFVHTLSLKARQRVARFAELAPFFLKTAP